MKLLRKILLQLLFLTPIGYFLSMLSLFQGESTPGVYIHLAHDSKDAPTQVYTKENPSFNDRFNWFLNGIILWAQTTFIISIEIGNNFRDEYVLAYAYGWLASIFGVVNIISSIFPKFNWNWKFPVIKISVIELVLLGMLVLPFVIGAFILWHSK